MLREKSRLFGTLTIATDFILILAGFVLSKLLFNINHEVTSGFIVPASHLALITALLLVICMSFNHIYGPMRKKSYALIIRETGLAHLQAFGIVIVALYLLKKSDISRQLVACYFLFSFILICIRRVAVKGFLGRLRKQGYNFRTILIVGDSHLSERFARLVEEHGYMGYRVIGLLSKNEDSIGKLVRGTGSSIIGSLEDLDYLLKTNAIDEVVFTTTGNEISWEELRKALYICEEYGVKISVLPALFDMHNSKMVVEEIGDLNLITFVPHHKPLFQRVVKRVIDCTVSAAGLLLLWPFMLAVAVTIKLDSPGPVFFRQKRCGKNGRVFTFLKFRSMQQDAEERRRELIGCNELSGPIFKIKDDPRITRVGAWLRKYSLDELPQLINVLAGQMSLVGPRPPLPSEVEHYERWQHRRLSVKPGITCSWQVSGRNNVDFEDWMMLDMEYIDNWSLILDFELLLKTMPAVIKGSGM